MSQWDTWVKIVGAVVALLGAVGGAVAWHAQRDPYRNVRRALEVRAEFKNAGADPRVWDRVVAAELADVSHPGWRSLYRYAAITAVWGGVIFAAVIITAGLSDAAAGFWEIYWAVLSLVLLLSGVVFVVGLFRMMSRWGNQLGSPYAELTDLVRADHRISLEAPSPILRPPSERSHGSTRMPRPSKRTRRKMRRAAG